MSIVIAQDKNINATEIVGQSDCLQGAGGRKHVLSALSSAANPMIQVDETDFASSNQYVQSAIIENLIIDGQHMGVTGILLENVCKCQIRNITIRNCEVGIHIRNGNYGMWSEGNCLKHIRMENVKTGILFTTKGPYHFTNSKGEPDVNLGDSAACTTIDDVDIHLTNNINAVGIQVGGTHLPYDVNDTRILPYSARIRANIWLGSNGGTGLKLITGALWYGQSQLTVHNNSNSPNGYGIDLQNYDSNVTNLAEPIWKNQFTILTGIPIYPIAKKGFMLVTSNITDPTKRIYNPSGFSVDVEEQQII